MSGFDARTHKDDDPFGFRASLILEQLVFPADKLLEFAHIFFNNIRGAKVIVVHRLASLEIDIGVLARAANHRMIGRKAAFAMCDNELVLDHLDHRFFIENMNLLNLVACSETVEEVQEREPRFEAGCCGDYCNIHDLLDAAG